MSDVDLVVVGNLLIDDLPCGRAIPGGAALYVALAARRWGLEVAVHSVVGPDYPVEVLEKAGVRLSLKMLEGPSGRTVIRYGPQGRTLSHHGPGHAVLSPRDPPPFSYEYLHVGPMPSEIQLAQLAQGRSGRVLLDPYPVFDRRYARECLPLRANLHTLLLNQEELETNFDSFTESSTVLFKQGAEGGRIHNPNGAWRGEQLEVVDPTGAGDAFAGGYVSGLVRGESVAQAVQRGVTSAGWALTARGAEGLLPADLGNPVEVRESI